jgi:hypothetical protein
MKLMLEIRYEVKDADGLYTFMEQNYPAVHAGGEADGFSVEGTWVALQTGLAYVLIEAKDPTMVYELCEKAIGAANSTRICVIPVIPSKKLKQIPG